MWQQTAQKWLLYELKTEESQQPWLGSHPNTILEGGRERKKSASRAESMGRTSPFTLYSLLLLGFVVVIGVFFCSHPVPSLSFLVGVSEDVQHSIALLLHSSLCIVHSLAILPSHWWIVSSNSPSDTPNCSNSALKERIVHLWALKFHICYRMWSFCYNDTIWAKCTSVCCVIILPLPFVPLLICTETS